jgi:hypothetical protein
MLPPDVARLKHTWIRLPSHAWLQQPFRAVLIKFLDTFLAEHSWVRRMDLEEKFTDTGINVKVPTGPTGPPKPFGEFLQRDGLPIIIIGATRERDGHRVEVALPFASANETDEGTRDRLLTLAKLSLELEERAAP